MWTLSPTLALIRSKVPRLGPPKGIESVARRRIEVARGTSKHTLPAIALEGQLDRVTGWIFASEADQRKCLVGGFGTHDPSYAYELDDAFLIDGVLYRGTSIRHLHPRTGRVPPLRIDESIRDAALYGSWNGFRWFGMWLAEDCITYQLAEAQGSPLTLDVNLSEHQRAYERRLGMAPRRTRAAHLAKAFVYDDYSHHEDKHRRARAQRAKLLAGVDVVPHPGVFLLRGTAGDRRVLVNEDEIAERVARERGLRIVDPMKESVDSLIAACAGARVVMGVEGSALMHGTAVLDAGATVFVLEPPNRFCCVYKIHADRDDQRFAYVVGTPEGDSFRIDPDEMMRTFDLVPEP